ncbi:hypothetical protein B0O80DRAFT_486094 [Mortierella sp. GBAus27b]|nr:hypothetical protein BGX31_011350 [Mortierella sp. GBA43]KAI8356324.1 hypothetical protein B0O80DRAFT_486094 [Mortierella sp. GBAus27b]
MFFNKPYPLIYSNLDTTTTITKSAIFDLKYTYESSDFTATLAENTTLYSETELQDAAREMKALTTGSISTILSLQEALVNLEELKFTVDLSCLTGNMAWRAASYRSALVPGPFDEGMMDPVTSSCLRNWVEQMMEYDEHSIVILLSLLQRNPRLRNVHLQLQPDHNIDLLIDTLGTLANLTELSIEGSKRPEELSPRCDSHSPHDATLMVLHILNQCRSLNALEFGPLVMVPSAPVPNPRSFRSPITNLNFWIVNRQESIEGGEPLVLHVDQIILHCPYLERLALPSLFTQDDMRELNPHLGIHCPKLIHLEFQGSCLRVPEFAELLISVKSLNHVVITACDYASVDLIAWKRGGSLHHQKNTTTTVSQSLKLTIYSIDQKQKCEAETLISMIPPDDLVNKTDFMETVSWEFKRPEVGEGQGDTVPCEREE